MTPVFKTVAETGEGLEELLRWIGETPHAPGTRKEILYAEKAFQLIRSKRMADISKTALQQEISAACHKPDFNLYRFILPYLSP